MSLQINQNTDSEESISLSASDKNRTWEDNHTVITQAMAKLIRQNERFPSKAEIAEETGLSRQTVHKHVKQFAHEHIVIDEVEQFTFMSSKVLAKIIELAMDGDVKAARLSLEVMGILNKGKANGRPDAGSDAEKRNINSK